MNIKAAIRQVSKKQTVTGKIVEVVGNRCAVMVGKKMLMGVPYIGQKPDVGDTVTITYENGAPKAIVAYKEQPVQQSQSAPQEVKRQPLEEKEQHIIYHNALTGLQGGSPATATSESEYYHLTREQWETLGQGGVAYPENKIIATNSDGEIASDAPDWVEKRIEIKENQAYTTPPTFLNGLQVACESDTPGAAFIKSSEDVFGGAVSFVKTGGNLTSQTAVKANWRLGSVVFGGATGNGIDSVKARIAAVATQDWSETARGAKIVLYATPQNSQTLVSNLEIRGDEIEASVPVKVPTPPTSDTSTLVATTNFVSARIDQDRPLSTSNPLMDGTASPGTSAAVARADHRHPTDTTRAPVDSPALTGTPTAPTPATTDNSTRIATTAYTRAAINEIRFLLPFSSFAGLSAFTQNSVPYSVSLPSFQITIRQWSQTVFPIDVNNSSNYWLLELFTNINDTLYTIASFTTASFPPNVFSVYTTPLNYTLNQTINRRLTIRLTKIGEPSSISIHGPAVEYTLA